jgi:predicted DNA-binding transcriptional regulator AlpA
MPKRKRKRGNAELLSASEAAEILGVTAKTLESWRNIRPRDLPFVRIHGMKIGYRKADVLAFKERPVQPPVGPKLQLGRFVQARAAARREPAKSNRRSPRPQRSAEGSSGSGRTARSRKGR